MPDIRLLPSAVRGTLDEWCRTRWEDLRFTDARGAILLCAALLAIVLLVLLIRAVQGRRPGRTHIALPALLPLDAHLAPVGRAPSAGAALLRGRAAVRDGARRPAHRLHARRGVVPGTPDRAAGGRVHQHGDELQVDTFKTQGESMFFTAVAGAESFIQRRMKGPYHDVVALIQFGNQAYVVTPFTTDYENILLSVRLIGDPREWGRFSDWGTTIVEGIDQATQLFKAFNFINASGNLMVVFTDGRDSELNRPNKPLDKLVNEARTLKIPVHMIRTGLQLPVRAKCRRTRSGRRVVERTGGRFYAAYDDESLLRALSDIDRLSPGRIETREYSVQRPRFSAYALAAVTLWLLAALLKLSVPVFRTFP